MTKALDIDIHLICSINKLMTGTQLMASAYKYKPVPVFQVYKVLQYMLVLQRALPYLVLV